MEVFGKHYGSCNPNFSVKLKSPDSVVTLAFAIMLLNTDLHTPNLKSEKKMQVQDFINNLRGVDGGKDFDHKLLKQIYKGIKKQEFVSGIDHVVQVQALQSSIVSEQGKPLKLADPLRRLVCLCRLYEVLNINLKKEPAIGKSTIHSSQCGNVRIFLSIRFYVKSRIYIEVLNLPFFANFKGSEV